DPVDRTAAASQPQEPTRPSAMRPRPERQVWQPATSGQALRSDGEAVIAAREAAAAAGDLDALKAAIEAFDGCALKKTASNTVVFDGTPRSPLLVIGEAPGAEEDRRGLPFVGPAGQMLDRMLAAIGIDRQSNALISNILFWRPPGNRSPNDAEIGACLPFVEKLIELSAARYLLLVGGPSAKTLLAKSEGVLKLRGRWFHYQNEFLPQPLPALVTLHPAYLLRQPAQKRLAWRDLLALKRAIEAGADPAA
ncbi:MAG: uracil-DNA glycosylase, partial [Kiloniellales bacterium]|nr:uracil-DNA glycosylase [Kiloniellales bacterium]